MSGEDLRLRLRDIGDARIALGEIDDAESIRSSPTAQPIVWKVAAGVLGMMLAIALWAPWRTFRPASQRLIRLTVELPDLAGSVPGRELSGGAVLISRDGERLVYTGRGADGKIRLYTRTLDQEQAAPIAGTEDASLPFFSPDGQSLGFFAVGKLKKTSVAGGGAVELCDAPGGRGGSWGEDGNIVAALTTVSGLSRVPASGGAAQPLTQLRGSEATHRWPQTLPGPEAVLFTVNATPTAGFEVASIDVLRLGTGERKTLVRGGTYGRYAGSGHLLYQHKDMLYAAPMDLKRLELTGPPTPVIEGVMNDFFGFAQVDISRRGTLVYGRGTENRRLRTLAWLESNGRTRPLRAEPANYGLLRFAPDGKRLAMIKNEGANADVWVYEPERDIMARLTSAPGQDTFPVWAPDGKHIAFSSDRHGAISNLYWMRADGAGDTVRLTENKQQQVPGSFSPDGKLLAFFQDDGIWTVSLDDAASDHPRAGEPEQFLQIRSDAWPRISPDGRWLAYTSDDSGRSEIYVKPFPGPGGKWLVSNGSTGPPVWSKKARELFYATSEGIMVVSYRADGATFEAAKPRVWAARKDSRGFDVAPDGKRLAVLLNVESNQKDSHSPTQVNFLLNFFDELRRRAPVGGK